MFHFDTPAEKIKEYLDKNGHLVIENILTLDELAPYAKLYDDIINGKVDANKHRHDLGSHVERKDGKAENICQVMWPSLYLEGDLGTSVLHQRVISLAKKLLGDDMEFDFDMLISKDGGSMVETPWHQDESYWLDLPDKRALSFWFPMSDASEENGCMQFIPGSQNQGLRKHRPVSEGKT